MISNNDSSSDESEKIHILRYAISLCKESMQKKITDALENISTPEEINSIYEENISRLLNNTYLLRPKGDRRKLWRHILLQRIDHDIEVWEDAGGTITLSLTEFAYQFVKGKTEMITILKEYATGIVGPEFGNDIIIRNYKPNYHKKNIVMEYANIGDEYQISTLESADIS